MSNVDYCWVINIIVWLFYDSIILWDWAIDPLVSPWLCHYVTVYFMRVPIPILYSIFFFFVRGGAIRKMLKITVGLYAWFELNPKSVESSFNYSKLELTTKLYD